MTPGSSHDQSDQNDEEQSDEPSIPSDSRLLLLVRHAKTEQVPGKADHERELVRRGRADAQAAGRWLAARPELRPDLVLCSTATRAAQTWEQVADAAGLEHVPVDHDRALYNAHPADLLEAVNAVDPQARCVALVAHAPGVPSLAYHLADPATSDPGVMDELGEHLPTMGCVVLAVPTEWERLGEHGAQALLVHIGREDAGDS